MTYAMTFEAVASGACALGHLHIHNDIRNDF
jgi:hypothetical protein